MEELKKEVFTKVVKAGRRTYYFDVRKMRESSELYITITESKKKESEVEKHKIFLYKEDFEKFSEALNQSVEYANQNNPPEEKTQQNFA